MDVIFYKDKLYAQGPWIADPWVAEVDASTGEMRTLFSGYLGGFYATDDTLYYFEADMSSVRGYEGIDSFHPGFRELDLNSGTVKDCGLPVEDILWVYYDEAYIYATGSRNGNDATFYILSRDYELLEQIELKDKIINAATSDRIYFCDYSPYL